MHALHRQPGQASGARIRPPSRTLTAPESAAHAHNTSVSITHICTHRRARRLTHAMHADADRSRACRRSGARSRSDPLEWRWHGGYLAATASMPEVERPRGGREWRSARSSPMAVCAPALRAPRHLRRRRWRQLSGGSRCGDERPVLSMIPVSCPVLGSQRAAHWERGHGGLSDGCIDRRARAVLADLPSLPHTHQADRRS